MNEPIKASEVARPDVDEETARKTAASAAVRSRMARIAALRGIGAVGPSSEDLSAKIEDGLGKRDKDIMAEFRRTKDNR